LKLKRKKRLFKKRRFLKSGSKKNKQISEKMLKLFEYKERNALRLGFSANDKRENPYSVNWAQKVLKDHYDI